MTALSAGLAAPSSALGHGFAHGRSAPASHHIGQRDTQYEHEHRPGHGAAEEPDAPGAPDGDHAHAMLDAGLTARTECSVGPIPATVSVAFSDLPQASSPLDIAAKFAVPIPAAAGPPPPSRAPPLP